MLFQNFVYYDGDWGRPNTAFSYNSRSVGGPYVYITGWFDGYGGLVTQHFSCE